jgi:hypothetical protein
MAERITLKQPSEGNFLSAGVVFVDGVALVAALSTNQRLFFEAKGATIEHVEQGKSLDELTKDELIEFALSQDPPIKVKARDKVDAIRSAVRDELATREADEVERQREANAAAFDGEVVALGQQSDNTVTLVLQDDGTPETNAAPPAGTTTPPATVTE